MPIYEYTCGACQKRFQKLVGVVASSTPLQCPHCTSTDVHRRMSRFARVRNADDTLDSLAEDLEAAGDTDDPKAMRRLMREIGKEMGEDLDEELEQMMEEESGSDTGSGPAGEDPL